MASDDVPVTAPLRLQSAGVAPGRAAPRADGSLALTLAGEDVLLLAERALYWPRRRTLFVADVHLGKAAAFRAGGVPLPRGATATDLGRLTSLLAATGATALVVLGDFLHAAAGRVDALDVAFCRWRDMHRDLAITLVRGNHDANAGDPPTPWRVRVVDDPYGEAPFVLCHEPQTPRTGYALCGHVHPGIRVSANNDSARLPCFVLGRKRALLPAFGRLTGLAMVSRCAGDIVVAVAGSRLFALPGASR